jgi:hypothetical protein
MLFVVKESQFLLELYFPCIARNKTHDVRLVCIYFVIFELSKNYACQHCS